MKAKTIIISLVAVATLALNGFAYFKYIRPQGNDKATGIVTKTENNANDESLNFDSVKQSLQTAGKWVKVTKKDIDPNYINDVNSDGNSNAEDNNINVSDDQSMAAGQSDSSDEYMYSDPNNNQDENMTVDPNSDQEQVLSDESDNGAENNDVDIDVNVNYVWVPDANTQEDFNPYTNGSWQWSDGGWVWVSNYGWDATYHYGRWWYSDEYGWVWSPGSVWAPSWVDWCSSGGYYGWHPISPREHHNHGWHGWHGGYSGGSNGHHQHETIDPHWTFVPKKDFAGTITRGNVVNNVRTKSLLTGSNTGSTSIPKLNGDGVKFLGQGPNVNEVKGVKVTTIQKPVTVGVKSPKTIDVTKTPVKTKNTEITNGVKITPPIDKTKNVTTIDKTKNVTITKGNTNDGTKIKNVNTIDNTKNVVKTKQVGNTTGTIDKTKNVTTPKVTTTNVTPKNTNETKVTSTPKVTSTSRVQNTSKTEFKTQQPEVKNTTTNTYVAPKPYVAPKTYEAPKQETKTYVPPAPKTTYTPPVQKQVEQKQVEQKPVQKQAPVQRNDQKQKSGD